jgi:hypothetical protein
MTALIADTVKTHKKSTLNLLYLSIYLMLTILTKKNDKNDYIPFYIILKKLQLKASESLDSGFGVVKNSAKYRVIFTGFLYQENFSKTLMILKKLFKRVF